jgi:hypothetical protein
VILLEHVGDTWIRDDPHAFGCLIDLVNDFGQEFDPMPWQQWEGRFQKGEPFECHDNSRRLATAYPELRYCEGFAGDYLWGWLPHAWCVNGKDAVIDPTWDEAEFYFGISLDVEFVTKLQREHNGTGNAFLVITRPELHAAIRSAIRSAYSAQTGSSTPRPGGPTTSSVQSSFSRSQRFLALRES